jgi:branched-chain amino acid aminotransferase
LTWTYINREWVETDTPRVPLHEAGFLRGDGIFESIPVEDGYIFRLDDHLERLFNGVRTIRIEPSETQQDVEKLIDEYIDRNHLQGGVIRVIITRGVYTDLPWNYEGENSIYITHALFPSIPPSPAPVVFLAESSYPLIRKHPAVKSLNYLGNMLAKMDAHEAGAFEPVLYNQDGYVTEGGVRNVFFVSSETILTPPLSLGILAGTMREAVFEVAEQENIKCREALISRDDLNEMDEAFLTSSAVHILPITWENWESKYVVTRELQTALNEFIKTHREKRGSNGT